MGVRLNGLNAAGKSVHAKLFGLLPVVAMATGFAPAKNMRMSLPDQIMTWFAPQTSGHESDLSGAMTEWTFQARLLETATPRTLVVFDQMGVNTIDPDGSAIAMAFFIHLVRKGARVVMISHHDLCSSVQVPGTAQFHPEVIIEGGRVHSTYQMLPGPETRPFVFERAREARVPAEVLDTARELLKRKE